MGEHDDDADARLRQWMRAAQEGDRGSYDQLLREIVPIIRRVVRRQRDFLPAADIEDLVQEALLSIHAVRATYDPHRPFMPWLMAIVRNRLADGGRRHARLKATEGAAEDFYETSAATSANRVDESYGDADELRHAIAKLPDKQRRAIELVKMREMSLKEASGETGMSIAALKVSVHRAIKALRVTLKRPT